MVVWKHQAVKSLEWKEDVQERPGAGVSPSSRVGGDPVRNHVLVDVNCDRGGVGRTTKVGKSGDPQMVVDVCRCSLRNPGKSQATWCSLSPLDLVADNEVIRNGQWSSQNKRGGTWLLGVVIGIERQTAVSGNEEVEECGESCCLCSGMFWDSY